MLALETQEAGTGKWFPIIQYSPGTEAQRKEADAHGELLRKALGLYVRVTSTDRSAPKWTTAPGHFDGDGCTFPTPGHMVKVASIEQEGADRG